MASGCAFDEIIDRRNNHRVVSGCRYAEVTTIRVSDTMNVGKTSFGIEFHEPRIRIAVRKHGARGVSSRRLEHNRCKDSSSDRNQMGCENEVVCRSSRQASQHFRSVAVLQDAIRPKIFIHFAEMRFLFGVTSGARNPGFAIGNDQRVAADHPCCKKGSQRHNDGRGITSRIGDKSPLWELRPQKSRSVRKRLPEATPGCC